MRWLRQTLAQVLLGQQHPGLAVLEHVGQAIGRVLRVQRHIGATGLERRQQADDHLRGALHAHRHQHIRADAHGDQAMGQTVGALVELGIGQGLVVELQGQRPGTCQGQGFEKLVHPLLTRIVEFGGIPSMHDPLPLRVVQHGQLIDAQRGVGRDRLQEVLPVLQQALRGFAVEQVAGVGQGRQQALGGLLGIQVEVELRGLAFPLQALHLQPGHRTGTLAPTGIGLVVEHHLEQRVVAQATLRLQGLHQLFERQVLVGLGLYRALLGLL